MGRLDLTDEKLFALLTQTPRPHRVIEFPRKELEHVSLAIRVLSQTETMAANAQAERTTRRLMRADGGDLPSAGEARQGYDDLFQSCAIVEVLFAACRKSDDLTKPFFRTPQDIRDHLSVDECGALFGHYLDLMREVSPIQSLDSDDGFEQWCARVVRGGSLAPLALLSLETQSGLIRYLMRQIWPSLNARSFSGSPVDSGNPTNETTQAAT